MAKSRIILKIPDRDVLLFELNFLYEREYKTRGIHKPIPTNLILQKIAGIKFSRNMAFFYKADLENLFIRNKIPFHSTKTGWVRNYLVKPKPTSAEVCRMGMREEFDLAFQNREQVLSVLHDAFQKKKNRNARRYGSGLGTQMMMETVLGRPFRRGSVGYFTPHFLTLMNEKQIPFRFFGRKGWWPLQNQQLELNVGSSEEAQPSNQFPDLKIPEDVPGSFLFGKTEEEVFSFMEKTWQEKKLASPHKIPSVNTTDLCLFFSVPLQLKIRSRITEKILSSSSDWRILRGKGFVKKDACPEDSEVSSLVEDMEKELLSSEENNQGFALPQPQFPTDGNKLTAILFLATQATNNALAHCEAMKSAMIQVASL